MQKLKRLVLFFTLILLLSTLALAQTNDTNSSIPPKIINPKDPTPKIDEKLEKEVTIPKGLQSITRIGLGINSQEKIEVSKLITLIALWVLIFIISLSALNAIPSLGQITLGISAFCITMLIGSTKAISLATDKWLANEDFFIFIDGWIFGELLVKILVISILITIALTIREKIKKENEKDRLEVSLDATKSWAQSIIDKFSWKKPNSI